MSSSVTLFIIGVIIIIFWYFFKPKLEAFTPPWNGKSNDNPDYKMDTTMGTNTIVELKNNDNKYECSDDDDNHYCKLKRAMKLCETKQKNIDRDKLCRNSRNDRLMVDGQNEFALISPLWGSGEDEIFFDFRCNEGEYINNLTMNGDNKLNKLKVMCTDNKSFTVGSNVRDKDINLSCSKGFDGVNIIADKYIDGLQFLCNNKSSKILGKLTADPDQYKCPKGFKLFGIRGNAGSNINQLGFYCKSNRIF
jgi:hypothetical protein